jgi:hypothetical protein
LDSRISAHPSVNFLVIVNPNSGPGGVPLPSHDYVREVPKLNAPANVVTVGYIRIDYCRRPLIEVYEEIDTYAEWGSASGNPLLYVEGILLDETPNHFSPERAEYLEALRQHIKSTEGLHGQRLVHPLPFLSQRVSKAGYQQVPPYLTDVCGLIRILIFFFWAYRLSITREHLLTPS